MKKILICMMLVVLCTAMFTACDGDSSGGTAAITTTTTKRVTTTTTEKKAYMSESQAISLATSHLKDLYSTCSPVVIGETRAEDKSDRWLVKVYGHCWKTDKYGSNPKKINFDTYVSVDKETGRCSGGSTYFL